MVTMVGAIGPERHRNISVIFGVFCFRN